MSNFETDLDTRVLNDRVYQLNCPLIYRSDTLGLIAVPAGFQTDFASVPRLPIIYEMWGDRAHREAVIHDYLYRKDSIPVVDRAIADSVFKEAMKSTGKPWRIWWWMWMGVRAGGWTAYHKLKVGDSI